MSHCRPGLRRNKNRKLPGHRERSGGGDRFSWKITLNGWPPLGWGSDKDCGRRRRVRRCAPRRVNGCLRRDFSARHLSGRQPWVNVRSVSYLNSGNGLSGGHLPARINFISASCTGDVSPAMLGLACSCLFNFMISSEKFYPPHDFAGARPANSQKRSLRRGFERRMFRRTTSVLKHSCRFDMSRPHRFAR